MRAFISYSNKDKAFARRLYESLTLAGVETFFDEKDIKVGDNIPRTIERGIEQASALIYVISSHSLQSEWVQEELSMAQVKAKTKQGFKILPVLIEPLQLGVGIAHIKYADFSGWEQNERFYQGFGELLGGLEVPLRMVEPGRTTFAVHNHKLLFPLESALWNLSAYIDGMMTGIREVPGGDDPAFIHITLRLLGHRTYDFADELGLKLFLEELRNLLQNAPAGDFSVMQIQVGACLQDLEGVYFAERYAVLERTQRNLAALAKQISLLFQDGLLQMTAVSLSKT
jgi:hypothetical protein